MRVIGEISKRIRGSLGWFKRRPELVQKPTKQITELQAELEQAAKLRSALIQQLEKTELQLKAIKLEHERKGLDTERLSKDLNDFKIRLAVSQAERQALAKDFLGEMQSGSDFINQVQILLKHITDSAIVSSPGPGKPDQGENRPESVLEGLAESYYWLELNLQGYKQRGSVQQSDWQTLADAARDSGQSLEQEIEWLREWIKIGVQAESRLQEIWQGLQQVSQQLDGAMEWANRMRTNLSRATEKSSSLPSTTGQMGTGQQKT